MITRSRSGAVVIFIHFSGFVLTFSWRVVVSSVVSAYGQEHNVAQPALAVLDKATR